MVARFPIADDDKIQRQKQRHLHSQEFHICSEKLEAQLLQLPCSNRQICHCELLHRCCTHASLCSCCSLIGRICSVACSSWDAMLIIYAMCYIWSDVSARPFMNQMELSPTLFYTVTFRIYFSLCTSFGPMCLIIFATLLVMLLPFRPPCGITLDAPMMRFYCMANCILSFFNTNRHR